MTENNQINLIPWISLRQLFVYLLCFAVPAIILSLIFPAKDIYIVLSAGGLMFAVAGLLTGLWWFRSEWTKEAKDAARYIGIFLVLGPLISVIGKSGISGIRDGLQGSAAYFALTYLPFFIGRAIAKRRTQHPDTNP